MELEDFLLTTIHDYENGGLSNQDFLDKARRIYNAYATFSCSLPRAKYLYLHGIVFSYFAKCYADNINYYTSIVENALFCYLKIVLTSTDKKEQQCAAIRLLLLINDNDKVMKGIVHKFYEQRCEELYKQPLMYNQILANGMAPWTFETDIITHIASECISRGKLHDEPFMISNQEMNQFASLSNENKYHVRYPLVKIKPDKVFELFFGFITEYVNTPFERRITLL